MLEDQRLHKASLSSFESTALLGEALVNQNDIQISEKTYLPLNSIRIEKILLKDTIGNIDIYKQRNVDREEQQKISRENAMKKKVLKNKHQYIAQNAYNNTNMEGILFERDMDLQRSFRFDKKVLKSSKLTK